MKKITIISFDRWDYDKHIKSAIKLLGHECNHIKLTDYSYKGKFEKLKNGFFKLFFNKNLKKVKRQEYLIERLNVIGKQDSILVINPELIEYKFHMQLRKFTNNYMAYLYDSISIKPIPDLLEGVFDKIFSFDDEDVKKYRFEKSTNYNYITDVINDKVEYDATYIGSFDSRIINLPRVNQLLKNNNRKFNCIVVGKRKDIEKARKDDKYSFIKFISTSLSQKDLISIYSKSTIIVDLVRGAQTGLSFRFFEAIGLNKKVITNNKSVSNYDFYSENNIAILQSEIKSDFFDSDYSGLDNNIFEKYHISNWVRRVFSI